MLSLIPLSSTTQSFEKGIRTVANLEVICPRHIGFGLANTRVASGQREPSSIHVYIISTFLTVVEMNWR